jgi:AraC-like DNA-binding protein
LLELVNMTETTLKSWPPSDPERVIAEYLGGKLAREIGAERGATENQVRQWLVRRKVRRPGHNFGGNDPGRERLEKWIKEGLPRNDMARRLHVSEKTLARYCRKHGLRLDSRQSDRPSRRMVRDAMANSDTREAAADRLGISVSLLSELCRVHNVKAKQPGHAWKGGKKTKPSPEFRRSMTNETRAGMAAAEAKQNRWTREVGTDVEALIASAVACGRVTKCPTAFAEVSLHAKPLGDDDRQRLKEHRRRMEAR